MRLATFVDPQQGNDARFGIVRGDMIVDVVAVANALTQQLDAAAQTIGKQMVALRPQLDYTSPMPVSASEQLRNVP